MNDPHALWLTLTNVSLGLVMLGAGVVLGASLLIRGREGAVAKARGSEVAAPVAEPSSATGG